MKWARFLVASALLQAMPATGLPVDCDNAFTKMERAICNDPQLLVVERQLSVLANQALGAGQIDHAQSQLLFDSLAQNCRRTQQLNQCLLNVAVQRLKWLTSVTDSQADSQAIVEADF